MYVKERISIMKQEEKTNVIRILQAKKIAYEYYTYECEKAISGVEVAKLLNIDSQKVFKTLVVTSKSNKNYVFVIPVDKELDLKKAALVTKEKYIEMIPQKDLYPLTGYVHGGCSPIGMKKLLPTIVDKSCEKQEKIVFSAGKIGAQVEIAINDLKKIIALSIFDVTKEENL